MTTYISESIHHVYQTLFEALLLVILVVFLSLQNWRATLIPIVAVPISLIGTFGVMLVFGFSLNMMTLLGLMRATSFRRIMEPLGLARMTICSNSLTDDSRPWAVISWWLRMWTAS